MFKNDFNLQRAFNWPALFLHNCVMCLSKFNVLFISNPTSLTLFLELMFISFIFKEVGLFCCFFSVNINGLELIRVYNYHAFSDSEVKFSINSARDFSVYEIVLSSAKSCNSAFSIQSKRSLMKMLGKKWDLKLILVIIKLGRHYMYQLFLHFAFYPLNKKKIFRVNQC